MLTSEATLLLQLNQLYGRQSFAIDEGNAPGWASTFTSDGEFLSPSYPAPMTGRKALEDFAKAVHAEMARTGAVQRHIITNVTLSQSSEGTWYGRAYLGIIVTHQDGNITLTRHTTIEDRLHVESDQVLVAHRTVYRDDSRGAVWTN